MPFGPSASVSSVRASECVSVYRRASVYYECIRHVSVAFCHPP